MYIDVINKYNHLNAYVVICLSGWNNNTNV